MRLLLATITLAVFAAQIPAAQADDNSELFCSKLGELAGRSIAARLSGTPIDDLLKVKFDPAIHEMFQTVITDAYTRPLVQGDDAFVKNMTDFRNDTEEKCQKALKK